MVEGRKSLVNQSNLGIQVALKCDGTNIEKKTSFCVIIQSIDEKICTKVHHQLRMLIDV